MVTVLTAGVLAWALGACALFCWLAFDAEPDPRERHDDPFPYTEGRQDV